MTGFRKEVSSPYVKVPTLVDIDDGDGGDDDDVAARSFVH